MLDAWAQELCGMRDMIVDFIDGYEADHLEQALAGRPGVPS